MARWGFHHLECGAADENESYPTSETNQNLALSVLFMFPAQAAMKTSTEVRRRRNEGYT